MAGKVRKQNMPGTESKAAQSDAVAASPDFRAKSGDFAVHIDNLCLHIRERYNLENRN
jgi:hypothetical protein